MEFFGIFAFLTKATDFAQKQIVVDPTDIEYAPYHKTTQAQKKLVFVPTPPRSTAMPPLENGQRPALSSVYENVLKENYYARRINIPAANESTVVPAAQPVSEQVAA